MAATSDLLQGQADILARIIDRSEGRHTPAQLENMGNRLAAYEIGAAVAGALEELCKDIQALTDATVSR